jgi:ELWxxDGT repeat protein
MEPRMMLAASMVQDLNTSPANTALSMLGHVGNVAIFEEADQDHGSELYRSDGTKDGTFLLRDIAPGTRSSDPRFFASTDNAIFFTVNSGFLNTLWKTDGTVAGTTKVADVEPVGATTGPHVVVGNILFFIGFEDPKDARRTALWKTDGTTAGTVRLTGEIANDSLNAYQTMAAFKGMVYFAANDTAHGTELWRSDGTAGGTKRFVDLLAGADSSNPSNLVASSDRLYFVDNVNGSSTQHLWKTDGQSVRIVQTSGKSTDSFPAITSLKAVADRLYFLQAENDAKSGPDSVWRTTGNANSLLRIGTVADASILPIDVNGGAADRICLKGTRPSETTTTYYSLKADTLTPIVSNTASETILSTAQIGNDLYFGTQLLDGSGVNAYRGNAEDGKTLLKHFADVPYVADFTAVGSKVYFVTASGTSTASGPVTSVLWIMNQDSSNPVKDVGLKTDAILNIQSFSIAAGNRLYFSPDTPPAGTELWISDGSPNGTHLVRDIDPRNGGSLPLNFTAGVGGAYFSSFPKATYIFNQSTHKVTQLLPFYTTAFKVGAAEILVGLNQIWRSDGTKAGTKSIFITGLRIQNAVVARSNLYFGVGENLSSSTDLWKSDGTANGTAMLKKDLTMSTGSALKNSLIFAANAGLWTTDGTSGGTRNIANVSTNKLYTFGNAVYFFVGEQDGTEDLWRSDGTTKGTKLIRAGFGQFNKIAVATDSLYIFNGTELWNSDGTSVGTKLLKKFSIDAHDVFITAVGNRVYFDVGHGLWTSFGGKTVLLKSINVELPPPDEGDSVETSPVDTIAAPNGKMYFAADDGIHGFELWETDATPTGTKLVKDIQPGVEGSIPMGLAISGNTLLFSADDGLHGREPWQFSLA